MILAILIILSFLIAIYVAVNSESFGEGVFMFFFLSFISLLIAGFITLAFESIAPYRTLSGPQSYALVEKSIVARGGDYSFIYTNEDGVCISVDVDSSKVIILNDETKVGTVEITTKDHGDIGEKVFLSLDDFRYYTIYQGADAVEGN